jgi:hypothetical protein
MASGNIRVTDDFIVADWIASRLTMRFGTVGSVVPADYPAYARICHPATDGAGNQINWSKMAQVTGRHSHALMQWHSLVGATEPLKIRDSLWEGANPERGNLDGRAFEVAL